MPTSQATILFFDDREFHVPASWKDPTGAHVTHLDTEGNPMAVEHFENGRQMVFGLTLCCGASHKGMDGGVGCRSCYGLDTGSSDTPWGQLTPRLGLDDERRMSDDELLGAIERVTAEIPDARRPATRRAWLGCLMRERNRRERYKDTAEASRKAREMTMEEARLHREAPGERPCFDGATLRLSELGSIYLNDDDRWVVSLIASFGDDRADVTTPTAAAAALLGLATDDGAGGTQWDVYDRQAGEHTIVELHELASEVVEASR